MGYVRRGTLTGHVYLDLNNNQVQDSGESNLSSVDVTLTDALGRQFTVTTDSNGNFLQSLVSGNATVDVVEATLPAGASLTTANEPQNATVPFGGTVAATAIGYRLVGTLSGHVYSDSNANATQDGGETGLANVTVLVVDQFGTTTTATTNANGDYTASAAAGPVDVIVDRPGTAYLMRRKAERDAGTRHREHAVAVADRLHAELARIALAGRVLAPQDAALSGRREEMVLNATYLVRRVDEDAFSRAVAEGSTAAGDAIQIVPTGPWPPFSFATVADR